MQRRHFQLIADTIQALPKRFTQDDIRVIANAFADMLARQNGRFDCERFLEACGVSTFERVGQ